MRNQLTLAILSCAFVGSLALAGVGFTSTSQAPPAAADLARQIQAHYGKVLDFTADFTHQFRGVLPQTFNERGTVRIKKPRLMFWAYTSPEKKDFVSDGSKIYFYQQSDNSVTVTDMPKGNTAVLFLAGQGDLIRDFQASLPKSQPEDLWELDLTPKTPQDDFTTLSIRVDRRSFALRGLTSIDQQGQTSTFTFTGLRENTGLSDKQFAFKMPPGAEVRR